MEILRGAGDKKPVENAKDGSNRNHSKKENLVLAQAKESPRINGRFDSYVAVPNPPNMIRLRSTSPLEHQVLRNKIERAANRGDAQKRRVTTDGYDRSRITRTLNAADRV